MTAPESTRPRIDLGVSQETAERLETHRALLAAWAPRINLIGPAELAEYWRRHALDSLQLRRHAQPGLRWLDLGAGAGFPGLVLACVPPEEGGPAEIALVERSAKKAAFLREAVRATGARAIVRHVKLETLDPQEPFAAVTARALAPLSRLIAHAKPWLDRGALGLFPKGADYGSELKAAGFPPDGGECGTYAADVLESLSDPRARIIRIRRID